MQDSDFEDLLTPEQLRELRAVQRKRNKKESRGYYLRQAQALVDLQIRDLILRFRRQGLTYAQIAQQLGMPAATVHKYKRMAIQMSVRRYRFDQAHRMTSPPRRGRPASRSGPASRALPMPGAGVTYGGTAAPTPPPHTSPGSTSTSTSGTVLDPPDIHQLKQDCLKLRKAAIPFYKMAILLGISEQEARSYCAEAIQDIVRSETLNADLERQLMIEQLDQMIAAIHAPATGYKLDDTRTEVSLHAIDRMLKLMQQKAELMGLSAPPAVDIRIKLQALASESGYDVGELEDIARDVLQAHRLRLPELK